MKKIILTLVLLLVALPVNAQSSSDPNNIEAWLKPVEAKYICMVNNAKFEREQIAVEVNGKTYYGCCSMCKSMLQNDPSIRTGVDPVSGNQVDKAEAVIGVGSEGEVYYFENQENFDQFSQESAHEKQSTTRQTGNHDHAGHGDMEKAPKEPEIPEDVGDKEDKSEQTLELHTH